jgi:hypothetical protein
VIHDFSNRIEVFPVDILAANPLGPLGANKTYSIRMCNRWAFRYEVTFEKYIIFHEFKEIACHISKKELLDCVARIDEATPHEKALILITIFIFERIHRKYPLSIKEKITNPVIPYYEPNTWTTSWQWHRLIAIIKKYEGNGEIAFPAIAIEDEKLKQSWSESYSENFKIYSLIRHPQLVTSTNENNIDSIVQTKLQSFDYNINVQKYKIIFDEYIYTIEGDGLLSGIGPAFGNSSATPKTLGDIATQLLMSRLPYEGINP